MHDLSQDFSAISINPQTPISMDTHNMQNDLSQDFSDTSFHPESSINMDTHNMQNDLSRDFSDADDERSQAFPSSQVFPSPKSMNSVNSVKSNKSHTSDSAVPDDDKHALQNDYRLHYRTIKGVIYHTYNLLSLTPNTQIANDSRETALVAFECAVASLLLHINHRTPVHIKLALKEKRDELDKLFRVLAKASEEEAGGDEADADEADGDKKDADEADADEVDESKTDGIEADGDKAGVVEPAEKERYDAEKVKKMDKAINAAATALTGPLAELFMEMDAYYFGHHDPVEVAPSP